MAIDTGSALRTVSNAMRLDEAALSAYLKRTLGPNAPSGPLEISQFSHGQSNPTYFIKAGGRSLVLRKQPPGKVLQSAHAVDREFRAMSAMARAGVPVPRMVALCTDTSVLGTPFYIMEFVKGQIFVNPSMPEATSQRRAVAYENMAKTLAAIHAVDPDSAGLGDYGRRGGYCTRQVKRWTQQYHAGLTSGEKPMSEMVALSQWLERNIPAHDSDAKLTTVSHGDFRLDNLVLCPQTGDVLAVLDWELSTLGDPLSDLAYCCLPYHLPQGTSAGLVALPRELPPGIPSEEEFVASYCAARGISTPSKPVWHFYLALSMFRAASIMAGIGARAAAGNASSLQAARVGDVRVVQRLAAAGLRLAGTAAAPVQAGLEPSARVAPILAGIHAMMESHIVPAEEEMEERALTDRRWEVHPRMDALKAEAKRRGLWNLWIPSDMRVKLAPLMREAGVPEDEAELLLGPGLTNLEYAHCAEAMARRLYGPEVFNCSAPDTGNMEVLSRYGTPDQQKRWLLPLLRGDIRSGFAMTEPDVASSDATNITASIKRDGDSYLLNGSKWWTSGAPDLRCKILVFMGKTDPSAPTHLQQSMILVPMDAAGVKMVRALPVYGYDDAPHGHALMEFTNVRVPASNLLLGEGRGFEIAQGRLGPGRLHHCMRTIGVGERAIAHMVKRANERTAFKKRFAEHQVVRMDIARSRVELDAARLLVLEAARALDRDGNVDARSKIAAAKVSAPSTVLTILDRAVQMHGGGGVSDVTPLAYLWAQIRTLRLADGPDVVHLETIAKDELALKSRVSRL